MFSLRQLKAFVAVAEEGSFTRAAKILYMTQPAISAQIKVLEDRLEIQLFDRHDKNILLTDAGELLLSEAKKMLNIYDEFLDALGELKGIRRGRLVIGASTIPGEYLLPQLIGSFKKQFPGVEVALKIADTDRVVELIKSRSIHLGIIGASVTTENIVLSPLLKDELILIAAVDHPLVKKKKVHVDEILKTPFVLREPGSGTRMVLEQMLNRNTLGFDDLKIIMELGSTRAVITAVEAGLGISVVSRLAADEALRLERIREVEVDGWQVMRNLYLARNETGYLSHAAQAFIDHLLNNAQKR
ncbi:MAG: selenium metabolism-associated LysR family transcriptional regulator [Bacillota bacterium]